MSSILLFTKHLIKSNLLNGLNVSKGLVNTKPIGIRFLFTDEAIGVSSYLQTRERIISQFGQMKEKFLSRIEEYTKSDSKMVFTEDVKNVIFLTTNDTKELSLLTDAIKKFHTQNQSLQFGTFVFGPIVMRLFHHLSECDLALQLFKDPALKGFFSQIKSVVLLMDMLFKNGRYEECMDVLHYIQSENWFEIRYPRDCLLLYIASAYKLNSPESFDKAFDMIKRTREADAKITRKTVCLFAALALKQKNPNIALEVLSSITQMNYISVRNLRLITLSELERFDDLFMALKIIVNRDVPPEPKREEILEETIQKIKEKIESKADKTLSAEFLQIEKALFDGNHISNQSLDEILLSPVVERIDPRILGQNQTGFRPQRGFRNPGDQQNFRRYPNPRYESNQ